jgi:hypothetical protein
VCILEEGRQGQQPVQPWLHDRRSPASDMAGWARQKSSRRRKRIMLQMRRHTMRRKTTRWLFHSLAGLSVTVAVSVLLAGCGRSPSRVINDPRIASCSHLSEVGAAIRDYQDEHGEFPARLSDLVPLYISSNQMVIFYETNGVARQQYIPSDWRVNPARIDEYSSYVYLGTNGASGILAFERTNLWEPRASYVGKVAVLFSDFRVDFVPIVDLQDELTNH